MCGCRYGRATARCTLDGAALTTLDDPMRGRTLGGRYALGDELGAGGMATVYAGVDTRSDTEVAVKVPDPELLAEPVLRERFLREGRVGLAVRHPRIAATLDLGQDGDTPFLVMERLRGASLDVHIARGALDVGDAVAFAAEVADALDALHRVGIVHRDVKPSNLFVVPSARGLGEARLLDLGIARILDGNALTVIGTSLGSARTMAPEQVRGEGAVPASDVYALGVVLFEMLTGAPPFRGNALVVRHAHLSATPARVSSLRPEVPGALCDLVDAMLQKDPAARPAGAGAVRERLLAMAHPDAHEPATVAVSAARFRRAADPTLRGVDPDALSTGQRGVDDLVARWNAIAPALGSLTRLHAIDDAARRWQAAPHDGSETSRRQVESALATLDDERRTLVASLHARGITPQAVREHLAAAQSAGDAVAAALRALAT